MKKIIKEYLRGIITILLSIGLFYLVIFLGGLITKLLFNWKKDVLTPF